MVDLGPMWTAVFGRPFASRLNGKLELVLELPCGCFLVRRFIFLLPTSLVEPNPGRGMPSNPNFRVTSHPSPPAAVEADERPGR
jgi:hypothetical protein